jgi:predicted phage-related endonuclease
VQLENNKQILNKEVQEMKLIPKPIHGTLEWLYGRQKDENGKAIVGGSDAPALMNASPYKSRGDLYHDKVTTPVVGGFNMAFHRGNVLEAPLVTEAERILKIALHTPDVMYRSGRWNINSDAVDNEQSPSVQIECKTTTRYTIASADDLPIEWRWQGWSQMAVLNVPVFFSVLDARQNLVVVELERNEHAIDALLSEGEMFCTAIDNGTGITDFIDDFTAEQIASLVRAEPTSVELPAEMMKVIESLVEAKRIKKEAEEAEKIARDEIARQLMSNEIGLINGVQVISWKQQAGKKSLDLVALRSEYPEVVAQFERDGFPYRVMRIKGKKETK